MKCVDCLLVSPGDNEIINFTQHNAPKTARLVELVIQASFSISASETALLEEHVESLVPELWCLLETV